MRLYYSDIFENFRCTGAECKDNCCTIGWDIEIDDRTLAFYKSLDTDLGRRLTENIYEEDGCHYMGQEGGCPFMNEKGLCSVQLEYGEENISDICREHPRFYEWFGDYKEAGMGLCCEEVCNMLVNHPKPILFTEKEIDENADDLEFDENLFKAVRKVRNRLVEIMQNRGLGVRERLAILLYSAEDIDKAVYAKDVKLLDGLSGMLAIDGFLVAISNDYHDEGISVEDRISAYEKVLDIFTGLDYIGCDLRERFKYARENITSILSAEKSFDIAYGEDKFELEHIAVYFIFRYFIKSVRDYNAIGKLYSAVLFTQMIKLSFMAEFYRHNALPSREQRAYLIKEFSKEIEYSEENTQAVYDGFSVGEIGFDEIKSLL